MYVLQISAIDLYIVTLCVATQHLLVIYAKTNNYVATYVVVTYIARIIKNIVGTIAIVRT